MPGQITLEPGPSTAIWNSDGIRLRSSRETNLQNIGMHVKPVSGSSYYTYVKVRNTGMDPIGACTCPSNGAWANATLFVDSIMPFPPVFPVAAPDGLTRLVAVGSNQFQLSPSGSMTAIGGPWPLRGQPPAGSAGQGLNSFWKWSPDGLFFAVAVRDQFTTAGSGTSANGTWSLHVYATRPYTRADGIRQIPRGPIYDSSGNSSASNVIAGVNLAWNPASTCLELHPPSLPGQNLTVVNLTLICPYADATSNTAATWSFGPIDPGPIPLNGWRYLHSPCGHLFALVPIPKPNMPSAGTALRLIDVRRSLMDVQQRVDNVPGSGPALVNIPTSSTAPQATLNTTGPGRRGIALTQMSIPAIDNPECISAVPALVNVRRVRVTTNPNQIDYVHVGPAAAGIWPGQSLWVELPQLQWNNPSGSTPGQAHYCLQANGDASPDDPSPGWANIDLNNRHYAQRNIVFA